jgi:hypothetical protein
MMKLKELCRIVSCNRGKKVKFSLFSVKYHAMKIYEGVEVYLHYSSTCHYMEMSDSFTPFCFTPKETPSWYPSDTVVPRASLDAVG